MSTPKLPEVLEKIVDAVLAYRPKPKSKAANKRKRASINLSSQKVALKQGPQRPKP